jgi:hypothetical protein
MKMTQEHQDLLFNAMNKVMEHYGMKDADKSVRQQKIQMDIVSLWRIYFKASIQHWAGDDNGNVIKVNGKRLLPYMENWLEEFMSYKDSHIETAIKKWYNL